MVIVLATTNFSNSKFLWPPTKSINSSMLIPVCSKPHSFIFVFIHGLTINLGQSENVIPSPSTQFDTFSRRNGYCGSSIAPKTLKSGKTQRTHTDATASVCKSALNESTLFNDSDSDSTLGTSDFELDNLSNYFEHEGTNYDVLIKKEETDPGPVPDVPDVAEAEPRFQNGNYKVFFKV